MISFYLTVCIFILLVAYAGMENVMRLFYYLDLQVRYLPLRIRMEFMKRKLRKQLDRDREYFLQRKKDAKSN